MNETSKPPVKINLGGRDLMKILNLFREIGWKTNPNSLKSVNLGTMMISGNMESAVFWHYPPVLDTGHQPVPHKDTLSCKDYSLVRNCPIEGQLEISSPVV